MRSDTDLNFPSHFFLLLQIRYCSQQSFRNRDLTQPCEGKRDNFRSEKLLKSVRSETKRRIVDCIEYLPALLPRLSLFHSIVISNIQLTNIFESPRKGFSS